ncbi:hypothetical protein KAFR_0E01200 [Kazachstania africana CBS 2517]|uniref:DNA-binding protein REB1 n=1 Tax=Kazachstania africana (strain ATCC 22294 / BCRC 22015 / CBS 2517 / CECT 1963 / NBRC 1671 / NRRL Y-8276) TaxID=1071382 RepID=H2AV74_KAZAF|nr:hypothetical protein KAFR_0E01200 [Kazachstania africana CBS 2517]CCF58274.1 hypothetical protein KAFR_0E01200 [Kazachstania africana CBS 2517]
MASDTDKSKEVKDNAADLSHQHDAETVEEAVFKYVRDEFQNRDEDEDEDKEHRQNVANSNANDDNSADMSWYLRHEEEDLPHVDSRAAHNDSESVAMAAVAAAYALGRKSKRPYKLGEASSDDEISSKKKKQKSKQRKSKKKMEKLQLAVDPELATLDDESETGDASNQSQLVRKAIIDTDSIAQHPDFQQYLNTEEEEATKANEAQTKDESIITDKEKNKEKAPEGEDRGDGIAVSVEDVAAKDYAELAKQQSLAKQYADVLPRGVSSISEVSLKTDNDNQLLQNAASKASELISATTQSSGKAFDAQEEAALDNFIEEYSKIKKYDRQQTCERIWTNGRRKDDFWINICKVLPYRTRSSIYKHVRRRYHIFEQRGKWTPKEDDELAKLCITKEGQWSEIGKILGRMPEDCRDRWRNYIKCGTNRASNKWSEEEEELLKNVIGELLEEGQRYHERRQNGALTEEDHNNEHILNRGPKGRRVTGKPSFKDIINWTVVSERMGGSRSRIQCRYKWNKLVKKQALQKIQSISDMDKRWILEKLRDLGFTEDSQVDWDELAALKTDSTWTGLELKLTYEKLRSMIKQYKEKNINEISKELLSLLDNQIPVSLEKVN